MDVAFGGAGCVKINSILLKDGGKILDIPVLDHIIVTSEGYYSFSDEGVL